MEPDREEVAELARKALEALKSGSCDGVVIRCWDEAEAKAVRVAVGHETRIQVTWTEFQRGAASSRERTLQFKVPTW